MVRAVNSGVSAFLDPNCRVVSKTYSVDPYLTPRLADKALAVLPLLEGGHTIYEAVGNLFAYLCAAVTADLVWLAISQRS
jgi:apolipoprotein N-acyltransferase